MSDEITLGTESLRAVVDLNKIDLCVIAIPHTPPYSSKRAFISLKTFITAELLSTYASSEESAQCLERIAMSLAWEYAEEPKNDPNNLESRVSALEKTARNIDRTLKCFISFRFDDAQTVMQVDRLKRLPGAVHIE